MSAVEPGSATTGLIDRVKAILLKPAPTWEVIDKEPATVSGLYKGYIIPLAAIAPVAGLIGGSVVGVAGFHQPLLGGIVEAVVSYILALVMVYVLALVIEALAPSFDGQKDRMQALKVATYASTAAWIAGIFAILPLLGLLALLGGLYSLYLLYLGLPRLMKAPAEKAMGYTIVTVIVAIVLTIVAATVATAVAGVGLLGGASVVAAASGGSVRVGDATVDLGELEAASKQVAAAAKQMESGEGVEPTDPDVLKAYLPAAVAGYSRTEVTTGSGGAGGMSGSSANGVYSKGDARLRLSVTDLGGAGALVGMAGAFNVKSSTESEGRYEKIGKIEGRMTQEAYDTAAKHGEYSVMVADRFMIAAEGDGVSMAELKAAVAAVGVSRLESLAKRG